MRRPAELRAGGKAFVERLDDRYGDRPGVSLARDVLALDKATAGGELAAALAYRLFLWFLPFVLVLVAGLGAYAEIHNESPKDVAARLGLAGLVVQSVVAAAKSDARWYALAIGIPVLLYVTRNLLRTVVAIHRLVWELPRRRSDIAPGRVLVFLLFMIAFIVVGPASSSAKDWTDWWWVVVVPGIVLARGGLWLALSYRLPNRATRWTDLLPGAAIVGVGIAVVNLFTIYAVAAIAASREDSYGALGTAAAVLFSLWLTSRVIVLSAVANTALWRRSRGSRPSA